MGIRTAVRQSGVLPYVLLAATLWTVVTAVAVSLQTGSFTGFTGPYVGQPLVPGLAGVASLLVIAAFAWTVYDESTSAEPAPEAFPPE